MAFIDHLDDLHEGQHFEFKEAAAGFPDDVWETYSAFANAEGGEIVLGVRETGGSSPRGESRRKQQPKRFEVVGVSDPDELRSVFWSTVRDPRKISADIMPPDNVYICDARGTSVLVIDVPRADRSVKPVKVYDRRSKQMVAWIRRGEGDFHCTGDELARMAHDAMSRADGAPIEEMGLDVLNMRTVDSYHGLLASIGHPWADDTRQDMLYHLRAIDRGMDGELHPTWAGLLAFGNEYEIVRLLPDYHLDYQELGGVDADWIDRLDSMSGDWSGNLVDFYLGVARRLDRALPQPLGLADGGMRHTGRTELNDAVHEAVANALVHAYYGNRAWVRVVIDPRRMRVDNSGSFLLDRDVAIAGGASEARNPMLMRIFGIVRIADRAGRGLSMIYRTWRSRFGREPGLTEQYRPDQVHLELPFTPTGGMDTMVRRQALPDDGKRPYRRVPYDRVLEICEERGSVGTRDLVEELGVKASTAQSALARLVKRGELERRRLDGNAYVYRLAEGTGADGPESAEA